MRLKKRSPSPKAQAPEPREQMEFNKHAESGRCVLCETVFSANQGFEVPLGMAWALALTSPDTRELAATQRLCNAMSDISTVCAHCIDRFR